MSDDASFDFTHAMRGDQLERLRHGVPRSEDLTAFRRMLDLSVEGLAAALGVEPDRLADWERGTTSPDRSQRSLLAVLARHPGILLRHELPIPA